MKPLDIMERAETVTLDQQEIQGFVEAIVVHFAQY